MTQAEKFLKTLINLKSDHLSEIIELRGKLSETAINKSEAAMNERMEASNGKYALLKEQTSTFTTKQDFDTLRSQVSILSKLVYTGLGGTIVLQLILKYFVK